VNSPFCSQLFLAAAIADFNGPLAAMRGLAANLSETHGDRGEVFVNKLAQIQQACAAAERLLAAETLKLEHELPETLAEQLRTLRHALDNQLTVIQGQCQLLERAERQEGFGALLPDYRWLSQYAEAFGQRVRRLDLQFLATPYPTLAVSAANTAIDHAFPMEQDDPARGDQPTRDFDPGRILIVDDNSETRQTLCELLMQFGHTALEAVDGPSALNLLNDPCQEPPDAILLDIRLGEINGADVLREIKADNLMQNIPVIMVSGVDDLNVITGCIAAGADDYLSKPIKIPLLLSRLQNCIDRVRQQRDNQALLEQIEKDKDQRTNLIRDLFPYRAVDDLLSTGDIAARPYKDLAIIFADLVGFTAYCDSHADEPALVVDKLRRVFEKFENSAEEYKVEKIKTIGDCYMGACWPGKGLNNVENCIRAACAMLSACAAEGWKLRVGIHLGTVIAGKVGNRQYCFDLWGDAVNTAARVQSAAAEDSIWLTKDAWQKVNRICKGKDLGEIELKGKQPLKLYQFQSFIASRAVPAR
jgi:class 3 adenylate cyclase/CheY-like chemotaxis protein